MALKGQTQTGATRYVVLYQGDADGIVRKWSQGLPPSLLRRVHGRTEIPLVPL